jgi:hypothetical protein
MKEKFKILTVALADKLQNDTLHFFKDHLKDEEETTHIINLVLSGHISSMFTLMRMVCGENEIQLRKVNIFIKSLMGFISSLEPIEQIEVIAIKDTFE